jgi:lycopene epsilon-cyclase
VTTQRQLGFGAAASMVHPATGYSVVRSLSEAPFYAAAIAKALGQNSNADSLGVGQNSREAAIEAWNALWPSERKRQRAFFLFGLELILQLDTTGIKEFFVTFFRLPEW